MLVARGTTQAYMNTGDRDARMIAVYTPLARRAVFREVCTPVRARAAAPPPVTPELEAGRRYNVEVGPVGALSAANHSPERASPNLAYKTVWTVPIPVAARPAAV